jgi:hypothetical protein
MSAPTPPLELGDAQFLHELFSIIVNFRVLIDCAHWPLPRANFQAARAGNAGTSIAPYKSY